MRKLMLLVLLLAGCPKATTSQNDANRDGGAPISVTVNVGPSNSIIYSPANVTIRQGDTIHWVWGSSGHSITSGKDCAVDNLFCSQNDTNCGADALQNSGDTYDHTFNTVGTFPYHCAAHCSFNMLGSVTVVANGSEIPDAGTITDAGTPDAGSADAGPADAGAGDGGSADAGCTGVDLTVLNYANWCSISVAGGAATTAASVTACVPAGTVTLSATPAPPVGEFQLGNWYGTTGAGDGGSPGNISDAGTTAESTTTATVSGSSACVYICCPFTGGGGCPPGGNQCP